jgi:hypothetical protein
MKISGHSTPHIFQRYNIIDESDLHEEGRRTRRLNELLRGGAIGSTRVSGTWNLGSSPSPGAKFFLTCNFILTGQLTHI